MPSKTHLNPTDFLLPTPSLSTLTLAQTTKLYSSAYSALPQDIALEALQTGDDWDVEGVWQQMMLFNGGAVGGMRRELQGFEEEMKVRQPRAVVESEEEMIDSEEDVELDSEDEAMLESMGSEEEEMDLDAEASENEEEIAQDSDGDSELREMMSDNDDPSNPSSSAGRSSRPARKSEVDDEFFSLHDMQAFSEKAEAWDEIQQGRNEEDEESDNEGNEFDLGLDFLSRDPDGDKNNDESESEEDDEDNANDIMYEDFFGPRDPPKKEAPIPTYRQEIKDDDLDGYYSTPDAKPPSPTFELDDVIQPAAADLFKDEMTTVNQSSFEKSQEKLTARISALEDQAVADKAWQLTGESTAKARPVNALLGESDLGIDYASKPVPVISVDSTIGLEDKIKARIKDALFDDVERRVVTVDKRRMKKDRTGEDEKSGQSLVQVYEKEYLRQSAESKGGKEVVEEETKEEKEVIELFAKLVETLDSLCNSHFTPNRPEVASMEVVVQAPAISVEEVIPGHVSNAQLVAPGDVYRAGLKQSKGEMESADRRREKRAKKAKGQKIGKVEGKSEKKADVGSASVKELLGMENVTMIKGKDGSVGGEGGKKRKAKVMEQGGEIGAKAARASANFIRL